MRIALIIWQMDTYGGSLRQCIELARELSKAGHDVELVTSKYDQERCFPELTRTLHIEVAHPIKLKQFFYNPSAILPLRIFGFLYNVYVQSRQVASLTRKLKERENNHHFDVINFHDNGVISAAAHFPTSTRIWMMNDPTSFIDTKEKDASPYAHSTLLALLVFVQKWLLRYQLRSIDTITVLDKRNKRIVAEYYQRKAIIVRSGLTIPPSLRAYRPKPAHPQVQIMTTNIFFKHRRYEDIVAAVNILVHKLGVTNFHYTIIGDPNSDLGYFDQILSSLKESQLESFFTFLGKVDEKTLKKTYTQSDIFVFPNHRQTWGLSVFEAMAHGCACIVSTSSGASEVLHNHHNALLVPPKSPQKLAQAMQLLIRGKQKRQKIAAAGHSFVTSTISWKNYALQMERVFNQSGE